MREDIGRVAKCRQRLSIRLIVIGSVANGHAGGSMHASPDGVAVADHGPSIASTVCIGASHDLDIGQSVMRLLVAAHLAMMRRRASVAFKRLAFKRLAFRRLAFKSSAAALLHPGRHAERRYPFGGFGDRL
ncbi:hypothetical protein ABID58_004951 [Bradyrhizobium sp. S3.2.6]|uniref:hypothetical protein n=1 Tax=Bradyrhizobium sp. S3.2.6 TaxID=3156428 RepID=UPI003391D8D3